VLKPENVILVSGAVRFQSIQDCRG